MACLHVCPNLLLGDVQDALQRQLLKVKAVTLVKVGADRLRVVVDHHRLLAHLSQSSDAGYRAPVKLNAAPWWNEQTMNLMAINYKHIYKRITNRHLHDCDICFVFVLCLDQSFCKQV